MVLRYSTSVNLVDVILLTYFSSRCDVEQRNQEGLNVGPFINVTLAVCQCVCVCASPVMTDTSVAHFIC